jgi:BirA family biotin operon repressor/biotin-[acetyl-CoA-carboxylase] ligase
MEAIRWKVHRLESCSSTNDVAKAMAEDGAAEGTVVACGEQTAGRGTRGRSWFSAKDKGLYFSAILKPRKAAILLLPLAAGLASREALERSTGLAVRLRWPNDILWQGRKIGGILCETGFSGSQADYAVVGIGLNLNHDEKDFPDEIRSSAISLRMALGTQADGELIFREVLASLGGWYAILLAGGNRRIIRGFEAHSVFRKGDGVEVTVEGQTVPGEFAGIGPDGSLRLRCGLETRRFTSADALTVRGRAGNP